jgi:hypothetical protein
MAVGFLRTRSARTLCFPLVVRRTATLAALVVSLSLGASGAAAALPYDLSADPLDRAALLALPSVYRVDVTIRVDALRGRAGRPIPLPPAARTVREAGTAFAVAADGWLATARHVAAPDDATIARIAYQEKLIAEDRPHSDTVVDNLLRSVGPLHVVSHVMSRRVRSAAPDGGSGGSRYRVLGDVVESAGADLALIHVGAPGAPTLGLDEAASLGTPVVTVGFGSGGAFGDPARGELEPIVRRGTLGRSATLKTVPTRDVIVLDVPVQGGDSGAPVVDEHGLVHGMVILRLTEGGVKRGVAERATEIRRLLEGEGLTPGPDPAAAAFREAMGAFWNLDMRTAGAGFLATLRAFPGHTLARREDARAAALENAEVRLGGRPRRRGALLALGILAAAVAAGFGIALLRSVSGGDRGARRPAGRGGGTGGLE